MIIIIIIIIIIIMQTSNPKRLGVTWPHARQQVGFHVFYSPRSFFAFLFSYLTVSILSSLEKQVFAQ